MWLEWSLRQLVLVGSPEWAVPQHFNHMANGLHIFRFKCPLLCMWMSMEARGQLGSHTMEVSTSFLFDSISLTEAQGSLIRPTNESPRDVCFPCIGIISKCHYVFSFSNVGIVVRQCWRMPLIPHPGGRGISELRPACLALYQVSYLPKLPKLSLLRQGLSLSWNLPNMLVSSKNLPVCASSVLRLQVGKAMSVFFPLPFN